MKYIIILLSTVLLYSCSGQKYYCTPSKKSRDYAEVILKEGSNISRLHERSTLVSIHRTMHGNQHLFVTDKGDSIYRTYQTRLCVGECYYILKNI